jgi:hypothetical protein
LFAQKQVRRNSVHPRNISIKCNGITFTQTGPLYLEARVSYSLPKYGSHSDPEVNPLLRPLRILWGKVIKQRPMERDMGGKAVLNSAGDPPSSPWMQPVIVRTLRLTRFEPFYDPAIAGRYENHVNGNAGNLGKIQVAKGQCYCAAIEPTGEYTADAEYVEVAYDFEIDITLADPFQCHMLDRGRNGFWSDSGTIRKGPITCKTLDSDGKVVYEPVDGDVLLDNTGKPLDTSLYVGGGQSTQANPSIPAAWKSVDYTSSGGGWDRVYEGVAEADFSKLQLT